MSSSHRVGGESRSSQMVSYPSALESAKGDISNPNRIRDLDSKKRAAASRQSTFSWVRST